MVMAALKAAIATTMLAIGAAHSEDCRKVLQ
jgi:hypothetical protein